MSNYERCVIDPGQFPVFEAPDGSREVQGLISAASCGANDMAAGLWWLHPGEECDTDIHPDRFPVRKGMVVYIPQGGEHQTFNTGDEDLCYFWTFAPPPGGQSLAEKQGWKQVS